MFSKDLQQGPQPFLVWIICNKTLPILNAGKHVSQCFRGPRECALGNLRIGRGTGDNQALCLFDILSSQSSREDLSSDKFLGDETVIP